MKHHYQIIRRQYRNEKGIVRDDVTYYIIKQHKTIKLLFGLIKYDKWVTIKESRRDFRAGNYQVDLEFKTYDEASDFVDRMIREGDVKRQEWEEIEVSPIITPQSKMGGSIDREEILKMGGSGETMTI